MRANILKLAELERRVPEWVHDCMRTDKGTLIPNLANAVTAFAALLPDYFAFDEMLQAPVLQQPLEGQSAPTPRAIRDADLSFLQDKLQRVGFARMGWDAIYRAVEVVGTRNHFHPVRDYLNGLQWDGIERLP